MFTWRGLLLAGGVVVGLLAGCGSSGGSGAEAPGAPEPGAQCQKLCEEAASSKCDGLDVAQCASRCQGHVLDEGCAPAGQSLLACWIDALGTSDVKCSAPGGVAVSACDAEAKAFSDCKLKAMGMSSPPDGPAPPMAQDAPPDEPVTPTVEAPEAPMPDVPEPPMPEPPPPEPPMD
jgi:hypothetical protein